MTKEELKEALRNYKPNTGISDYDKYILNEIEKFIDSLK